MNSDADLFSVSFLRCYAFEKSGNEHVSPYSKFIRDKKIHGNARSPRNTKTKER